MELDADKVVVVAAAAPGAVKDKAQDVRAAQPPGRAASAFAPLVDIGSHTPQGNPARKGNAPSVVRG